MIKNKISLCAVGVILVLGMLSPQSLRGRYKMVVANGMRFFEIEELNHLFQTCQTGHPSGYGQIEETFSLDAMVMIAEWILKVTKEP